MPLAFARLASSLIVNSQASGNPFTSSRPSTCSRGTSSAGAAAGAAELDEPLGFSSCSSMGTAFAPDLEVAAINDRARSGLS